MMAVTAAHHGSDIDAVLRAAPGRPFGVNFLMPFFDRAVFDAVAPRVALTEWYWGPPDPVLVAAAHDADALAAWQVGSVDEARAAADAGCDLIVVQGVEAGGHVRGTVGLLPLLDAVLDAVEPPVVAAGGIGTARGLAAVLAAGASAARIGTRFVATYESGAHPGYQQSLVAANADDTVLTEAYSVGWPDAPHRVLRSAVEAAEALAGEFAGDAGTEREPLSIPRFAVRPPNRETRGDIDAMALYAGQSVGAVKAITSAADVVRELAEGAERLLTVGSPEAIRQLQISQRQLAPRHPSRT
jgi:nitronate monooxygenase